MLSECRGALYSEVKNPCLRVLFFFFKRNPTRVTPLSSVAMAEGPEASKTSSSSSVDNDDDDDDAHPVALRSSLLSLAACTSHQVRARVPSMEDSVKFSGGAVAALLAMRYAGSLQSACLVGLVSGLFAHSLYADVLRKNRRRRRRRSRRHERKKKATEEEAAGSNGVDEACT